MATGERGLFTLSDLKTAELESLVARSCELFKDRRAHSLPLNGKIVGMLFAKTSTRTRTAFTVGTVRLGGHPITYGPGDLQTNTGESIQDTGRILSRMLDAVVVRAAGPVQDMRELSRPEGLPVINAMAAEEHPTQGVCDLAAMLMEFGSLRGLSVVYVGEGNNTATALAYGLSRMPQCDVTFATPPGYGISPAALGTAATWARESGGSVTEVHDMDDLPDRVDVVYTTRWQTTGTVKSDPDWREKFRDFYVDERLLRRWPAARLMHDLPAHRGEEISGAALDGPASIAWSQAEMKLTSAMAVLEWVAGDRQAHADVSR